jgi:hypothetical protein
MLLAARSGVLVPDRVQVRDGCNGKLNLGDKVSPGWGAGLLQHTLTRVSGKLTRGYVALRPQHILTAHPIGEKKVCEYSNYRGNTNW